MRHIYTILHTTSTKYVSPRTKSCGYIEKDRHLTEAQKLRFINLLNITILRYDMNILHKLCFGALRGVHIHFPEANTSG